jgi:DNA processing protein
VDYKKLENWKGMAELKLLKDLSTPPKELYYKGEWEAKLFKNCVGVVGSRRISDYGRRAIEKIVPQLVMEGKTVVSGFMYGVDQYAHQVTLDSGGKTVAILGWGIGEPFGGTDGKLADRILGNGGLILSEWERQQGTHWTFPVRDRIIAALCKEVVVVEAAMQSGSLITARIAGTLGRTVWAVPGPITSRTSVGTNNLIASGKAQMWLGEPFDNACGKQLTGDPLVDLLAGESLTADEVARKLNKPVAQVGAQLSLLLVAGKVSQRSGKYYLEDAS